MAEEDWGPWVSKQRPPTGVLVQLYCRHLLTDHAEIVEVVIDGYNGGFLQVQGGRPPQLSSPFWLAEKWRQRRGKGFKILMECLDVDGWVIV